jgi:predicted PurR-regulated permease PerM
VLGKLLALVREVLVRASLAIGGGAMEIALSVFLAFFILRDGGAAASRMRAVVGRIAGERGPHLLEVAGNTVRSVVYGLLGTALVQGLMAGVGFLIARVPGAPLLGLLTFFLSVVPMGPPLIWVPVTIWLFAQGRHGAGVFMLFWGLAVSSVDNVIRPWLIGRGTAMPFILMFVGVVGGALAFGFIGVFLGPTLLAVVYRLMLEWSRASEPVSVSPSTLAATAA